MKLFQYLICLSYIVNISFNHILNEQDISEDIKYLIFSFNRNLTIKESFKSEEILKELFYNQIYINIKVGSQKKDIPFYLYLEQYSLAIESKNVSTDQVKGIYDESESNTYEDLKESEPPFIVGDISKAILSKDIFYFNNDGIQSFINFYLCKENHDNTHITEGGKIGFKLNSIYAESEKSSFITNLKQNKLISSSIFSFKYDSKNFDEETGKLYIGSYPHLIDKIHYKEEYYNHDNSQVIYPGMEWNYLFDEIKISDDYNIESNKAYFYFEIGFILGTKKYFNYIKSLDTYKEYFENNNKCQQIQFSINDLEANDVEPQLADDYTAYRCNKDVDVKKINIGNLLFIKKTKEIIFNLTDSDLWIEKNGYNYFLILEKKYYNDVWCFGKPIFKKYSMVFDIDNKQIGFYTQLLEDDSQDNSQDNNSNNNKSQTFIYVIIIIGLVIIIIGLAFFLVKCYINLPRKKRANEMLDDNYDYNGEKINN